MATQFKKPSFAKPQAAPTLKQEPAAEAANPNDWPKVGRAYVSKYRAGKRKDEEYVKVMIDSDLADPIEPGSILILTANRGEKHEKSPDFFVTKKPVE